MSFLIFCFVLGFLVGIPLGVLYFCYADEIKGWFLRLIRRRR